MSADAQVGVHGLAVVVEAVGERDQVGRSVFHRDGNLPDVPFVVAPIATATFVAELQIGFVSAIRTRVRVCLFSTSLAHHDYSLISYHKLGKVRRIYQI